MLTEKQSDILYAVIREGRAILSPGRANAAIVRSLVGKGLVEQLPVEKRGYLTDQYVIVLTKDALTILDEMGLTVCQIGIVKKEVIL